MHTAAITGETMRHLTSTDKGYCHTTPAFRVADRHGTYGIGFVAEGREGRQEHGGPLVPGPWGWVNQHATVIDNTGHAHRAFLACETFAVGETFTVEGLPGVWQLTETRRYPAARPELTITPAAPEQIRVRDARDATGCYCPSDCACHFPHRYTYCGCTGKHA